MSEVNLSFFDKVVRSKVQHYNEKKYWKYRNKVIAFSGNKAKRLFAVLQLFYIKRCDAFNNATLGTHIGFGAQFSSVPILPHGLYGIIVSHNAVIGKNCVIFHQVTIGEGKGGAPTIGDNVFIGAGAKIIGNIKIGSNVTIGAGAVVVEDIPNGATVVCQKPRVIIQ